MMSFDEIFDLTAGVYYHFLLYILRSICFGIKSAGARCDLRQSMTSADYSGFPHGRISSEDQRRRRFQAILRHLPLPRVLVVLVSEIIVLLCPLGLGLGLSLFPLTGMMNDTSLWGTLIRCWAWPATHGCVSCRKMSGNIISFLKNTCKYGKRQTPHGESSVLSLTSSDVRPLFPPKTQTPPEVLLHSLLGVFYFLFFSSCDTHGIPSKSHPESVI